MKIDTQKDRYLVLKIFSAFVFSILPPLILVFIFQSNLSLSVLVMILFIKTALALGSVLAYNLRRFLAVCSLLYSFIFAAVVFLGIIIIPFKAYAVWFEQARFGFGAGGPIANLLILLVGFFSSAFAAMLIKKNIAWPFLILGLVLTSLFAVIFQTAVFFAAVAIMFSLCLVYLALGYSENRFKIMYVVYTVMVFVVLGWLSYAISGSSQSRGIKFIDELYAGIRQQMVANYPQFQLIYDIPGQGASYKPGSGPLYSPTPLFEIEAPAGENTLYLKVEYYDRYLGSGLLDSKMPIKQVQTQKKDGFTLEEEAPYVEPGFFAGLQSPQKAIPDAVLRRSVKLKVLSLYYERLPYTIRTSGFYFSDFMPVLEYGNFASGFLLDETANIKAKNIIYLIDDYTGPPEPAPYTMEKYLQVYKEVPPAVLKIAQDLGHGKQDKREILSGIEEYLAGNYIFDLKTDRPQLDEDFLQYFLLKNKKGYSFHFATAFVLLARMNNIPARLNRGFLVVLHANTRVKVLSERSSHFWPEVWLEDQGWVTWEATPAMNPKYFSTGEEEWSFSYVLAKNTATTNQLKEILGDIKFKKEPQDKHAFSWKIDYFLLGIIFFFVIFLIFVVLLIKGYGYLFRYLCRKDRKMVALLSLKIVNAAAASGLEKPEKQGWGNWFNQLAQAVPGKLRLWKAYTGLIVRIVYGQYPVRTRDVNFVFAVFKQVKGAKRELKISRAS